MTLNILPISIEEITYSDLPKLRNLSIETFNDSFKKVHGDFSNYTETNYNYGQLAAEMINPQTHFYFIYYNHKLAGYLKLNLNHAQSRDMGTDALEIDRIYLRQNFEYIGLESKLIQFAFDQAKKFQKHVIWSRVWEHDDPVVYSYNKFGFKVISSQLFKLAGKIQKDLIMQTDI